MLVAGRDHLPRALELGLELDDLPVSPGELNRAVAFSMAFGPAAGLAVADGLLEGPALEGYHLLSSVRGDLLEKLGRLEEAQQQFERAASLTRNGAEKKVLLARAAACASRR